jgi:hypothetical protein
MHLAGFSLFPRRRCSPRLPPAIPRIPPSHHSWSDPARNEPEFRKVAAPVCHPSSLFPEQGRVGRSYAVRVGTRPMLSSPGRLRLWRGQAGCSPNKFLPAIGARLHKDWRTPCPSTPFWQADEMPTTRPCGSSLVDPQTGSARRALGRFSLNSPIDGTQPSELPTIRQSETIYLGGQVRRGSR